MANDGEAREKPCGSMHFSKLSGVCKEQMKKWRQRVIEEMNKKGRILEESLLTQKKLESYFSLDGIKLRASLAMTRP